MALLPKHVGIILDGNGRWAAARGLPRQAGHEEGARAARRAIDACLAREIPYVTLYTFSVANWRRPPEEIAGLMHVARSFAEGNREDLARAGVRVEIMGELDDLPTPTRHAMDALVAATAGGRRLVVSLALNYGGRADLVSAIRSVAAQARAGTMIPEEVTERTLRSLLTTSRVPDPDLVIRTGGEKRLSDFLLFEAAYAELFFTDALWPDFTETMLDEALETYARRQRRFGLTGAQVAGAA